MQTARSLKTTDCCPPLFGGPTSLSATDADLLASRLRVLAEPTRLRLLGVLYRAPDMEACVCDLVGPAAVSQPTVSHHLKELHEAGFISRRRRGQWVHYRLEPSMIETIRDALNPFPD